MSSDEVGFRQNTSARREERASALLREAFTENGWSVLDIAPARRDGKPDFVVRGRNASYAVEIKAAAEGRSDRLVPLWAQAYLEAARHARAPHSPLAVVVAPRISSNVVDRIIAFAEKHTPGAAVGILDFEGLRVFRGPYLEPLNARPRSLSKPLSSRQPSGSLFSDLNQWMIKVLLAAEIPEQLLSAPRGRYTNASELAEAAKVSVMTAFRFIQRLKLEGFLHESSRHLQLVRRQSLFSAWANAGSTTFEDVPMRFLLPSKDKRSDLTRILDQRRSCLALFAAADALGFGFVSGVPEYVYVERLAPSTRPEWRSAVPTSPGERPDFILRRAPATQSVFRGVVTPRGLPCTDVIQTWLDVSGHRSRGQEQADLIRRKALRAIIEGTGSGA